LLDEEEEADEAEEESADDEEDERRAKPRPAPAAENRRRCGAAARWLGVTRRTGPRTTRGREAVDDPCRTMVGARRWIVGALRLTVVGRLMRGVARVKDRR
jgi:hypothetical protein